MKRMEKVTSRMMPLSAMVEWMIVEEFTDKECWKGWVPIILGTQEAQIRKIVVQSQPQANSL
jgi:hypothetical protein